MKILFICNQNKNRSKTAEEIFKGVYETKSAGLYNGKPVTEEIIAWADIVVTMDDEQRSEIGKRFPRQYIQKQIISLNVPDIYLYNQPELVTILKSRMKITLATH